VDGSLIFTKFAKGRVIMKHPYARNRIIKLTTGCLLGCCLFAGFDGWSQLRPAAPATLVGVVSNGLTGNPIIGARINVNGILTYSVSGGVYSMSVDPPGTYAVLCSKQGFGDFNSTPVTFMEGVVTTMNIQLQEILNPPEMVTALFDSVNLAVNISYSVPSGNYELLYDDGLQDNFTVWAAQGNINAVKFTLLSSPATLTGGSVHIGNPSNYPVGCNPLVPFQINVYDDTGPNHAPGNMIAGPFDVIPSALGWVEFQLPYPVNIPSSNFYIGMVQGGNAPNAAGLAIDATSPQFRSYSRFITGGMPWLPASGNFMIRAVVHGPGGPPLLSDNPAGVLDYQIWRLRQGEEMNPSIWVSLATTTATSFTDYSWPSLPCSPYRWGVKARYTFDRWSPVTFSNVIGKCWTAPVTINITLSCSVAEPAGTSIQLKNLAYPDTNYFAILDTNFSFTFPQVWKGTYELKVERFGYETAIQTVSVMFPLTTDLFLLQEKPAPDSLMVNDQTLFSQWQMPVYARTIFSEDWSSGSYQTQGWSREGGMNWVIATSFGNPAPSAKFNWEPQGVDYEQTLVSKEIQGAHSAILTLQFDISLDNFSTSTVNMMAVEIWDGTTWHNLETFSNSGGSIPWLSKTLDISDFTHQTFKIRFRAYGSNTFDINGWYIDNILIRACESPVHMQECILGYYFYLDNLVSGFATDTVYTIPGEQVTYGNTYNACVSTAFASGLSEQTCHSFTSGFLWPARNLTGTAMTDSVLLTWDKPSMPYDTIFITPPGLLGYNIYRNNSWITTIPNPDSLNFYDTDLDPGSYTYEVNARYDLTPYGFPGLTAEAGPAGPVTVVLSYGSYLPFFEPWDNSSFSFNDWSFFPAQGNWRISNTEGNPAPSAMFTGEPGLTDYSFALVTQPIDATPQSCAAIWLDFDLRLDSPNSTGEEKLLVEILVNNSWRTKAEYINSGSFGWTARHINISAVEATGFEVRFRITGRNSTDISGWYLDNVHLYAICYPASNLLANVTGYDVYLTWSPPDCHGGAHGLNEGFESDIFPPPGWTQIINNGHTTWSHIPASSPIGVHSGYFCAGITTDYFHQDEWLIAHQVLVTSDLTFWSLAFQGSANPEHFYVKISMDDGIAWQTLFDLTALPPYPSTSGYNKWETPYVIDLSGFTWETVDIAWQAVDETGSGLYHTWAIDDVVVGSKQLELLPGSGKQPPLNGKSGRSLTGYDVYRQKTDDPGFLKINPDPVTDTGYLDHSLNAGSYLYYIQSIYDECLQTPTSDTVLVDVITGTAETGLRQIRIYPNPVTDILYIESPSPVCEILLFNVAGNRVFMTNGLNRLRERIDLSGFPSGLYILQVNTKTGTDRVKIVR